MNNPITPPPEPPVDGEVPELVALIRQCALAWEPDARLLGNMTAAQLVRAAELLERTATQPPEAPTISSVEDAAKAIYSEAMTWAAKNSLAGITPPWVEGGNSTAQDVARQVARSLAAPPPEPPTAGDTGENEQLRSLFDLTRHQMADALGVDRGYGWTSLAMEARQLQEDRARAALATPPPEPPTDEELQALWHELFSHDDTVSSGDVEVIARAALERWGK